MKPVVMNDSNMVFGGKGYGSLPGEIYYERINGKNVPCIQTVWELTDEELEKLKETKRIYVSVVGEQPQPICLDVESFTEE